MEDPKKTSGLCTFGCRAAALLADLPGVSAPCGLLGCKNGPAPFPSEEA